MSSVVAVLPGALENLIKISMYLGNHSSATAAKHQRWAVLVVWLVLLSGLVSLLCLMTIVDHDLFHEMALARAMLQLGHMPVVDLFAYTPTLIPCVHHEWGTGLVLYVVTQAGGAAALMTLKYLLTAGVVGLMVLALRRPGGSWNCPAILAPLAMVLGFVGFTTIRAQLFSLLFIALLLWMLRRDAQGKRRWIWAWLLVYVLWLNLHAGFVVGLALLGAHWREGVLRGKGWQWHLVAVGGAMLLLLGVNPYGWEYVPYLWRGLTMPRPEITEWWPIWRGPVMWAPYLLSVLVIAYTWLRCGWRNLPGLLLVLPCALEAMLHLRHLSIYALVWMCYVPAWLSATPLSAILAIFWQRWMRPITWVGLALLVACWVTIIPRKPWQMQLPIAPEEMGEKKKIIYPSGAVTYLRQQHFHGNVMTAFSEGSYVCWNLYPAVKISLDGRYEVAYPPEVFAAIQQCYGGKPTWQQTLTQYPTDLVLVRTDAPLAELLDNLGTWPKVYHDGVFALYTRPGINLPIVDATGRIPSVPFP